MPEISDADFELLQLSKTALGNSKTRLTTLRAIKEASPDTPLPELDQEARTQEMLKPLQDENKALKERLDKAEAVGALEKKRDALRAKGLNVEEVEKVMVEKGITSHEAAAEFISLNNRPAAPVPSIPSFDRSARVPAEDGLKKDPKQWARETAANVLKELQAAKK